MKPLNKKLFITHFKKINQKDEDKVDWYHISERNYENCILEALPKHFGYQILLEKISEQWVDPDSLSTDEFDNDIWLVLKNDSKYGYLYLRSHNEDEFEMCRSFKELEKLYQDIHNKIIWKNSKQEMLEFITSDEVKYMPYFYRWKHKNYDDFKQKNNDYRSFLNKAIAILHRIKL